MSDEEFRKIAEQQKEWQRNEEHQAQIRRLDKQHWDGVSKDIDATLESRRRKKAKTKALKAQAHMQAEKAGIKETSASYGSFSKKMTVLIVLSGVGLAGFIANAQGIFEGYGIPISLAIGGILAYALREIIKKILAVLLAVTALVAVATFFYIVFPDGMIATLVNDIINL